MNFTGEILILTLLLLCSAYFSGTEAAFMSASHVRLKSLSGNGNKRAQLVLRYLEDFDKVLSTLLIGNNIVNILAASIATDLFTKIFPGYGVTISTVVMTLLVLVFGEVLPKSAAKQYPESLAMTLAAPFRIVYWVLRPLSLLFHPISHLIVKLTGNKPEEGPTEEELITMLDEAEEGGAFKEDESELIRSAIEFNDVAVEEVLTRRVNMVAIEDDTDMDEVKDIFFAHGFSRIPVYHETIDNIIGILYEKDFMAHYISGEKEYLSLLKEAIYVPKSMKISALLRELQTSKSHLALVSDEGGGIEGLITMEDILEELVGEIWDEHDEVEILIQQTGDGSWRVSGHSELDDVFETLGIEEDPDEFESTTLGGWMTEVMERIPVIGEELNFFGYLFRVSKANQRRVIEVVVKKAPEAEENTED